MRIFLYCFLLLMMFSVFSFSMAGQTGDMRWWNDRVFYVRLSTIIKEQTTLISEAFS